MAAPLDTLVFVYGTLKRGFLNYEDYLGPACSLQKAEFLCEAVTTRSDFCLVVRKDRKVPCLYRPRAGAEEPYAVPGELFRVDKDTLRALDILEGVDEASYYREEIEVTLTSDGPEDAFKAGQVVTCHIYLKVFDDELVALENVSSYTSEHHEFYKSRARTPKLRILECIYGKELPEAVRRRLEQKASSSA
jgi:gamma-glutamylaminecyclotransferase